MEPKRLIKARILLVEDESIVALDLHNRVRALGYDVLSPVASGEEAIRRADASRPDLVLMDISLKGRVDGIQAAEEIRKRHQIPIIYITALTDEKTLQRAKATEPFGYLVKPFEDRELYGQIEIALYKHRKDAEVRESEERYSLATKGANDGLWDWDLERNKIYLSPRLEALLGLQAGELSDDPEEWFNTVHPADRRSLVLEIAGYLRSDAHHFQSEYRVLHRDGTYRWMLTRGFGLRDPEGKVFRMAGSQTDITELKLHDPLTGLPNRALFMDRLDRALERVRRGEKASFSVMALKPETLSRVKESLDYSQFDELLTQLIRRVRCSLDAGDTVVSLGEEAFAVLLESTETVGDAIRVAVRAQENFKQSFRVGGQEIFVPLSVGIAQGSPRYDRAEDLLRDAQAAVRRARENDSLKYAVFDHGMHRQAVQNLRLESRLRKAVEREEFVLHYQPIVDLQNGCLTGFEALVRWLPDGESIVMPGEFIPVAESTGLIVDLGRWVLWKACAQLREWQSNGLADQGLSISVNFSREQYRQPDLVQSLKDNLLQTGLDPRMLKLEITESIFLEDPQEMKRLFSRLLDLNVPIHVDDFGTGYSSLSFLQDSPFEVLKIDRTFIQRLRQDCGTRQIVKAITNLGHNLQMKVTAEGVEDCDQLLELQQLACHYGQGFLFSKPLTSEAATRLIVEPPPSFAKAFSQFGVHGSPTCGY